MPDAEIKLLLRNILAKLGEMEIRLDEMEASVERIEQLLRRAIKELAREPT